MACNQQLLFPYAAFNDRGFKEIRLFQITALNHQMHKRLSQIITLNIPICFSPQGTIIRD